jgi:putative 4-mercaptohistidine N1-methyltranferase
VLLQAEAANNHVNYESPDALSQYLLLHFGSRADTCRYPLPSEGVLGFPQRCATLLRDTARQLGLPRARALDLGCAVGGATFELARDFRMVIGIDLSPQFIAAANGLKVQGRVDYAIREEGERQTLLTAVVDPSLDRERVRFERADACALPHHLGQFDAVLLSNLLCRLPDPRGCLSRLGGPFGLVAPGGLVLIASPYSWSAAYTPPADWLGEQQVRALLDDQFALVRNSDEALIIREHARKFEYVISHVTLWRRCSTGPVRSGRSEPGHQR